MAARAAAVTVGSMVDIVIRDVPRRDLPEAAEMLAGALDFRTRDSIPPWMILTTSENGGLAIGAYRGARLVGFSYALPALSATGTAPVAPHLFSCGLAVVNEERGRGVGRRLKLAQRDRAIARGIGVIRWTADPMSAAALHLYLSRLNARLVGYRAGMYTGLRAQTGPQDDVEIAWELGDGPPSSDGQEAIHVEIPADVNRLSPHQATAWRRRVRRLMSALLADGYVGTAVEREPHAERCRVRFVRTRT
jgi:predicted GNAT superfamily acetyltransferase